MIAPVVMVAFCSLDVRSVEVECAVAAGLPGLNIIGLADKAVSEARERKNCVTQLVFGIADKADYPRSCVSRLAERSLISILQ